MKKEVIKIENGNKLLKKSIPVIKYIMIISLNVLFISFPLFLLDKWIVDIASPGQETTLKVFIYISLGILSIILIVVLFFVILFKYGLSTKKSKKDKEIDDLVSEIDDFNELDEDTKIGLSLYYISRSINFMHRVFPKFNRKVSGASKIFRSFAILWSVYFTLITLSSISQSSLLIIITVSSFLLVSLILFSFNAKYINVMIFSFMINFLFVALMTYMSFLIQYEKMSMEIIIIVLISLSSIIAPILLAKRLKNTIKRYAITNMVLGVNKISVSDTVKDDVLSALKKHKNKKIYIEEQTR